MNKIRTTQQTTERPNERRGSVLVLVMTLLGILFVLGVTFLATMNFEADMIAAEKSRGGGEQGAATLTDGLGGAMRGRFIDAGGSPFGGSEDDTSGATFAELPGVHNVFSTIEPINMAGSDGISGTGNDLDPAYASFTDASRGTGVPVPNGVLLDTNYRNGDDVESFILQGTTTTVPLIVCRGGTNKGNFCDPDAPEDCPGSTCSGPVAVDADGDGIVDSFLSNATEVGLSPDQITQLSNQVNGPGSEETDVFVGLRTIPHGGMANLNESHPTIIEAVFGLNNFIPPQKLIAADGTFGFEYLLHSPSGNPNDLDYPDSPRSRYSPSTEESLLRRRGFIPPRLFPPSTLQGNPLLSDWENLNPAIPFGGDMAQYLFWPDIQNSSGYETVLEGEHRFTMFAPDDPSISGSKYMPWTERMDSFLSVNNSYDLRHLVTTTSHDDLLARGGTVDSETAATAGLDIIKKMFDVNRARAESGEGCPDVFPFEYLRYPHDLADAGECCDLLLQPHFDTCQPNIRKGRLQVSLPWLDLQVPPEGITEDKKQRIVYDAFYLMLKNAVGEDWLSRDECTTQADCGSGFVCKQTIAGNGRCSASASYFDDVECTIPEQDSPDCNDDEFCGVFDYNSIDPTNPKYFCSDKFTGLQRSKSRLTRTAASLTANFFDFADTGDVPTRIAIRMMDLDLGICLNGNQAGRACHDSGDCGGSICDTTVLVRGKPFDFDGSPGDPLSKESLFVYGLERQPYITEIGSITKKTLAASDPSPVTARAIELFNPYGGQDISFANSDYFFYEVAPGGSLSSANIITLSGTIGANDGPTPFAVFTDNMSETDLVPATPASGTVVQPATAFQFAQGWTVYLVRRIDTYRDENDLTQPDPSPDLVVLDQVTIPMNSNIGITSIQPDCTRSAVATTCRHAQSRGLANPASSTASIWTTTIPIGTPNSPEPPAITTFGDWNGPADAAIHPVEVNFANDGPLAASFPTTGSMLLLMRHANRAIIDMDTAQPSIFGNDYDPITDLAFTTALVGDEAEYKIPRADTTLYDVVSRAEYQIDNGRMPIFDLGEDYNNAINNGPIGVPLSPHHVAPGLTKTWDPSDNNSPQTPGKKQNLPWGQFVFDYFTAIPLDSAGPYPPCTGGNYTCSLVGEEDAKPRVDLDGLRVHGRINLNAAPATVLRGLPFIPMDRIPGNFQTTVSNALGLAVSPDAETIGFARAQAIVAYRDAREIRTNAYRTGDYGQNTDPNGTDPSSGGAPSFGWRGWTDTRPSARRGTGFMTVGELANVRHEVTPGNVTIASTETRLDNQAVNFDPTDNSTQNFIAAAATLIALNDWATVRSHVFTVYGHIRGAENKNITDPKTNVQADLRRQDLDLRAIRFQETIDRLPTFLGKSLPVKIGNRTVGAYLDESND